MRNKGKNKTASSTAHSPDKLNRIVEGTNIKGDIVTDSNFRLDGFLDGTLKTSGKLVIGESGKIEGKVQCANADIEGEFNGDIIVDGLLILKSTAKVTGNVTAGKLGIENGAEFNGKCNMGGAVTHVSENGAVVNETEAEDQTELVY